MGTEASCVYLRRALLRVRNRNTCFHGLLSIMSELRTKIQVRAASGVSLAFSQHKDPTLQTVGIGQDSTAA